MGKAAGQKRELGFSYGLGNLSAQSEKIALTFGGSFVINGELSVVALIAEPERGQKATLEFPQGAFTLIDSPATQVVPPATEKTADGRPRLSTEASVDGFPIRVPVLDIHTVGAGGGSLARVDEGGLRW